MRRVALLLVIVSSAGMAGQNRTLNSTHEPTVVDGRPVVPGCPDWSDAGKIPSAAATSSNYGCASASNLAAMIADPRDLMHGRVGDAGLDGRTSVKAIGAWRNAKTTGEGGLKAESIKDMAGAK